jgi:hypothetical protein
MRKNLLWLFLYLSFPFFSFAQSNYKPGYIINLKNDTVKGYIDYKEWTKNPKQFYFKPSLSEKSPEKYSAITIKAFSIINLEFYKSAVVKVSKGNVETNNLSAYVDTTFTVDTVFLKVVSTGKNLSLYSLTDENKIHFYVEEKSNHSINELNYYVYLSNSTIRTIYTYRNQLQDLANVYKPNQNEIGRKIDNALYSQNDIAKIIGLINGGENENYKTEKLSKTQFFAGVGVKQSKITFNGINGPFPAGNNQSSTSPTVSLGANFIINKNTEKVLIRIEAAFADNKFNFSNNTPGNLTSSTSLALKQFNATIIPQIIYNFYSTKQLKVFVDAGVALNISMYNNYNYIANYFDGTTTVQNQFPQFNKGFASFPLKAGVFINDKVEIYGGYSFPSSIVSSSGFGANITSYQAGINYMF